MATGTTSLDRKLKSSVDTFIYLHRLTEADATPLLACLEVLQSRTPEEIAAEVLEDTRQAQEAEQAELDGEAHLGQTVIAAVEATRPLHDIEGETLELF